LTRAKKGRNFRSNDIALISFNYSEREIENMNTTTTTENAAFFYIDGIPTKGTWVELDESTTWETIAEAIREKIPSAEIDEILCADAEGMARHFLSRHDCFDLNGWQEWIAAVERAHYDAEIIAAYCDNVGQWDESAVTDAEDNYCGTFENAAEFAEDYAESTGMLESIPENLRHYFDFEKFGNDMLCGDVFESDGHYFYNR
jgi:antirestriction protein